MSFSILITKAPGEFPLLEAFCNARHCRLKAESFIRFEPMDTPIPEYTEAIFFGSPRAVDYFLRQAEIPSTCSIACIGSATERHLIDKGYKVDFSGGSSAGDPDKVAAGLREWLGDRKLYIACSNQSNRSIARALPESSYEELIVYRTVTTDRQLAEKYDMIIFTSPSNLEGYLLSNSLYEGAKIIAWGKTTEKALIKRGHAADHVLASSSESELIGYLSNTLGILK